MNRRIRWLGIVLVACFALLFLQLNNIEVRQASKLAASKNQPQPINTYTLPRGDIYSSDQVLLARSKHVGGANGYVRIYPAATATLFAGVTGYESAAIVNSTGLELEYNQFLSQHNSPAITIGQLFIQQKVTDDVILTMSAALQKAAATALDGRTGAVVAIDPRTGAILAMYGNPTFNPNLLSVNDRAAGLRYYNKLVSSPVDPLLNYPAAVAKAPGSTFKVVDTSAIFDQAPKLANETWPEERSIVLPETSGKTLQNFGGEECPTVGNNLAAILLQSCDTAYALVGQKLGAEKLYTEAVAFGFNRTPPIDLPQGDAAKSNFPQPQDFVGDIPGLMKSAIGQENVTATTLQMALVAAGIANDGVIMAPHLMDKIIDDQGNLVETYRPHAWRRATSPKTSAAVRQLMLGVTQNPDGTAYGEFPSDEFPPVAAKTGTAQINAQGCGTYNWLIATAPAGKGETPKIAVAAIVPTPAGPGCSNDATGAKIAGPVVAAVLQKALELEK
jgi:peptidoglycan glycosyltransferase